AHPTNDFTIDSTLLSNPSMIETTDPASLLPLSLSADASTAPSMSLSGPYSSSPSPSYGSSSAVSSYPPSPPTRIPAHDLPTPGSSWCLTGEAIPTPTSHGPNLDGSGSLSTYTEVSGSHSSQTTHVDRSTIVTDWQSRLPGFSSPTHSALGDLSRP